MKAAKTMRDLTLYGVMAMLLLFSRGAAAQAGADHAAGKCAYDLQKQPVASFDALIDPSDPYAGALDAPVTLMEFFDPNCPHCRGLHPVIQEVLDAHQDHLRVVYKPIALPQFPASAGQTAALFAAAEAGKFSEMLALQFARQHRGGLSLDDLKALAREIGMDAEAMAQQIQAGVYADAVDKRLQQAREAGVSGVPAVILNGRFVAPRSRTAACLNALIEDALPH